MRGSDEICAWSVDGGDGGDGGCEQNERELPFLFFSLALANRFQINPQPNSIMRERCQKEKKMMVFSLSPAWIRTT
jgi:hypothetical protein